MKLMASTMRSGGSDAFSPMSKDFSLDLATLPSSPIPLGVRGGQANPFIEKQRDPRSFMSKAQHLMTIGRIEEKK